MKVLFISNHSELSGWSSQACNHILALDAVGVDVYPINVNVINNRNPDIHPRIAELEKKRCVAPDVIIENVLPSMFEKSGRSKCVSYFVCETSSFQNTGWQHKLNLADLVLCPCYSNKLAAINSGVTSRVEIVPECVDLSKYAKQYKVHPLREQLKDKFLFLVCAEWTVRKNIDAIIKAFHCEFNPLEPVELVIKTTPVGMSNPQVDINNRLEAVKRGLKLYNSTDRYKRENVICGFLSEQDLASLFVSCDAYVNASRAEAFSIPTMDALGFGLPVVSPNHSGLDYLTDKNSFLVDSRSEVCFGANDTMPELYSAGEVWNEISIQSLCEQMRNVYSKQALAKKKVQIGREIVKGYALEKVSIKYKETLEKLING